jgi:hypothetical protein
VRAAADVVLFLDTPVALCVTRAIRRSVWHLWRQRPELPPGCPEWQVIPQMLKILWSFPRHAGLDIRNQAAQDRERFRFMGLGDDVDWLIEEWLAT